MRDIRKGETITPKGGLEGGICGSLAVDIAGTFVQAEGVGGGDVRKGKWKVLGGGEGTQGK